jgi:hypothetical protein
MVKQQIAQLCTKRSQKASDSIICLDDDIKANLNNDETEITLQDTTRVAEVKIGITITLLSEEESMKSGNEVKNQQPPLTLKKKSQTLVKIRNSSAFNAFSELTVRCTLKSTLKRHIG